MLSTASEIDASAINISKPHSSMSCERILSPRVCASNPDLTKPNIIREASVLLDFNDFLNSLIGFKDFQAELYHMGSDL